MSFTFIIFQIKSNTKNGVREVLDGTEQGR